ncbi:MAG: NUDIX domain-containing protein [Candidatus Hydrogenedentes bacterium]|nr:NUDIX domain-containing protein [Candidatus Hydrogenedentota bacterium]
MNEEQALPFSLSVKAIVMDKDKRCLVLRRSMASKNNAGKWEFPGGKLNPGESFDNALEREVHEETGLEITLLRPFDTAMSSIQDRRVVYLFMLAETGTDRVRLSNEHDAFQWVAVDRLAEVDLARQFQSVAQRMAEAVLNGAL